MNIRFIVAFAFFYSTELAWSQIHAIDDAISAKDRISKYLLNADQSQEDIAVFYREQSAGTPVDQPDLVVVHQNSGIFIQSAKEKIRYMSADFDSLGRGDTPIPFRYESFIVNGKEKRRFYDISRVSNIATAKEVPLDPETGQRQKIELDKPDFFGYHGREIEPFGLIIGDRSSADSRFSSIDFILNLMLAEFKFESEKEEKAGLLTGKWRRGDYVREITFDDRQGGLPVLTKNYVVDSKGKATSDYNSSLRCSWKEVSPENWVVEKLSISLTTTRKTSENSFEFVWCDAEKREEFFKLGEFKRSHKFDDGVWQAKALELFFPEAAKQTKNGK